MNDKKQLAAMGEHLADQQPLCMANRIEELEAQVLVMEELLRDLHEHIGTSIPQTISEHYRVCDLLERIDAALAGKLPVHNSVTAVDWSSFPGWLIDHHEGDTITEEMLQFALADMLAAAPKPEVK